MAKHEERVAAGCVRAALWACAAPCDCPPGAEDPAPPVWSRLLLVLAHPQTQPCLHPGSRRYPGAGAGRPGQAAQSPSAGHRPLTETPLPPAGLASRPAAVFSPAPRTPHPGHRLHSVTGFPFHPSPGPPPHSGLLLPVCPAWPGQPRPVLPVPVPGTPEGLCLPPRTAPQGRDREVCGRPPGEAGFWPVEV